MSVNILSAIALGCAALLLPTTLCAAPNVEALSKNSQNDMLCNAQMDWCLGVNEEGPFASSRTLRSDRPLWDGPEIPDPQALSIWPKLIRLDEDRALAGVILTESEPWSGGGMTVETLYLFEVTLGDASMSNGIGIIPLRSNAEIRACFSEADEAKRKGACHDQYAFDTELTIVDGGTALPELHVQTRATRFPTGVRRTNDSTANPPLTSKTLATETDTICSYQATYSFDEAESVYAPTTPLPDCTEFLQP